MTDRVALETSRAPLALGPDVIEQLIPHRRPFVMIDRLTGLSRGDAPALWASRHVSSNEPVFDGHFPGLHLWPGVYTIEGMGQACHALAILDHLEAAAVARGGAPGDALALLHNEELAARLDPGFRPEKRAAWRALSASVGEEARRGLAAAVDVKLLAPVFAGERIDFFVARVKTFGHLARFDVEASVDGRVVARGALTGAHAQAPATAAEPSGAP